MSELYPFARSAQMPRNGIISLLSDPNITTILKGSYVRVLLELPGHHEDYHLARVEGVENSEEPYCGFSQQVGQYTTILLKLQLPNELTGINGSVYQLNSISNSPMTPEEFDLWVAQTAAEFVLPTAAELSAIAERVRPYATRRSGAPSSSQVAAGGGSMQSRPSFAARPLASTTGNPSGAELSPGGTKKESSRNTASPRPAHSGAAADDELPTRSQVQHQILNELRDKNALFPINISELKTSLLRVTERDLIDYLENVRCAIIGRRSVCVVCMDQVASVIMLPCRHKVLCRFCAPSVSSCPCCREVALELFEPVEI